MKNFNSKKKIRIVDIFMIVGLMIMAFMSKRHFSLFIILGMISVTGVIVRYLVKNNRIINDLVDSRVFLIIVILEVLMIGDIKFGYNIKNNYVDEKIYPVDGVKYLKDNMEKYFLEKEIINKNKVKNFETTKRYYSDSITRNLIYLFKEKNDEYIKALYSTNREYGTNARKGYARKMSYSSEEIEM